MKLRNLIVKDIKNIVYDGKSLAILVIMPIVIMTILGFSLKNMFQDGTGSGLDTFKIAVVKEYDSQIDKEAFLRDFSDSAMFSEESMDLEDVNLERIFFDEFLDNEDLKEAVEYRIATDDEIEGLMDSGDIAAAVYLPEGFVYDGYVNFMTPGRNEINIDVVGNPDYSFISQIVVSIIDGFVDGLNIQKARIGAFQGDLISQEMGGIIGDVMENMELIVIENPEVTIEQATTDKRKSITSFQYYAAAIMSMFLLYSASFGGKAILSEKKEYTLARASVSGVSINAFVFSNFVRIAFLCVFQSTVMIVFSSLLLGVDWGSIPNIVVGVLLISSTVGALGMMISVITLTSGTFGIANFFEFVIIQFMALVGGSFIPVEILPEAVGKLSFLSISGMGIEVYTAAMYELPLSATGGTYLLLAGYTIGLTLIALILIKINGKKVRAC